MCLRTGYCLQYNSSNISKCARLCSLSPCLSAQPHPAGSSISFLSRTPFHHKHPTKPQNSDIFKGLFNSDKPTVKRLVNALPRALLHELENDKHQAGQFICEILAGNIPGAFENLVADLTSDVVDDIQEGVDDITSFVKALPTLAPEILDYIISDGKDVVSVVEEPFIDPEGVITLIENGGKTVISDIESVATSLWHGFTCLFKPKKDCSTSAADSAATLSNSCGVVMAAATTTWSPAASSSTYTPPQPTAAASSSMAVQTSTTEQAAQSTRYTYTQEVEPAATTSLVAAQATTEVGSAQTTSQGSAGGGGGVIVLSGGGLGFVLRTWLGVLACLIGLIIVL